MSAVPTPQPETPAPTAVVSDRTKKPQGVIPKNVQSWVWVAVALITGVGIFFSSGPKKPKATGANEATIAPAAPGGLTLEQVQKRLQDSEDEARRNGRGSFTPGKQAQPGDARYSPDAAFLAASQPTPTSAGNPFEEEQRKREYMGRYASNIA